VAETLLHNQAIICDLLKPWPNSWGFLLGTILMNQARRQDG
jgi:hypothetical protein